KKLVMSEEPLTFLGGAGVSIEPPSSLMSAWQIMEAILRFGAVEEALDKLLGIKNLRFEYLIQQFRDEYDDQLQLMKYYEQSTQPNLIHQFLAQMLQAGHFVMTTNFDTLIERAIGLEEDALQAIITREDFEKYGDPQKNVKKGIMAVYKLHGALNDPKTGKDTRESVITTLDALGKHKEGELFAVEPFKRELFAKICQGRTLIVMGYSGGDDFDIIPTLLQMKGIKRVIWIAHSAKEDSSREIYHLIPQTKLELNELAGLRREDEILYNLTLLGSVEVIKMVTHTASLIADLVGRPYEKLDLKSQFDAYSWISDHFPHPDEGHKEYFTAKVFLTYGVYAEALNYFQKAYEICNRHKDLAGAASCLNAMGVIYGDTGSTQKALESLQEAYEIHKRLEDLASMAMDLGNMGTIYRDTGMLKNALEHFQRAYTLNEKINYIAGMASDLGDIGLIHMNMGQPQKALENFQRAYEIDEQLGNLIGMANRLTSMGLVYMTTEELKKALEHHQKAQEIYSRLGDLIGMAGQLNNIGLIYMNKKETQKALECYQRSYELYKEIGDFAGMARQLNNVGLINMNAGAFQKALEYYQRAYEIDERLGNLQGKARYFANTGLIYMNTRKEKKALANFQKAYEIHEGLENLAGMAQQLRNIALAHESLGNLKKALEYLQKAHSIYKQLGNSQEMVRTSRKIAEIRKKTTISRR
ncbi:MAG: tetratricopeptide repeat protein, partial [Promethearchaeota archaeon]